MNFVASMTVDLRGDREITITRSFNAPRERVYNAHVDPDLVRQWLLGPGEWSMPVCEIDLRVGGSFRYVWRHPGKDDIEVVGTYRELAPPARIVHTEVFVPDWTEGETLVTTTFEEDAGVTTMTMVIAYASRAVRDRVLESGMADGMEAGYQRLSAMLGPVDAG